MTTLVKKYPIFEDNQVLTSSQLNNLVDYLDQQNRLTRTSLIGVGIVCGLELSCQSTATGDTLTISKGVGVTSEGYLVKMGECVMTQMRTYSLPEVVKYPPFENPETGLQDISLQELLTADATLDEQDDPEAIIKADLEDKVVLLFVECVDKDLKSCLGKSCDELGIDRLLNIRKLLISTADLQTVLDRTEGGFQDTEFPDRFSLPEVTIPRALFSAGGFESNHYAFYSAHFIIPVASVYFELIDALDSTYSTFQPLLEPIYGENPFQSAAINDRKAAWLDYLSGNDGTSILLFGSQYFYDFIKDLILAYREFRDTACELMSLCCPDSSRFPKHLMLGYPEVSIETDLSSNPRHSFTQTPIYNNQKSLLEQAQRLHKRVVLLIEKFDLNILSFEGQIELLNKVTPSCEKKSNLSERSIPHYYDIASESSFENLNTLENSWRRRIKNLTNLNVVSYQNNDPAQRFIDPVTSPLDFDVDTYDFLRIEGHLGKEVESVIAEIEQFKTSRNLGFDIKAAYLGPEGIQLPVPECLCADLQPDYAIWRNKTNFFLKPILALIVELENLYSKKSKVNRAVKESVEKEGSIWDKSQRETNSKTLDFAPLSRVDVSLNRENWYIAGKEFDKVSREIKIAGTKPRDPQNNLSEEERTILQILNDFNNCLKDLVASMTVDFKDFNLDVWISKYQCILETHIKIMRLLLLFIQDNKARGQYQTILDYNCKVHRVLTTLAIYPYITIRLLVDTKDYRIKQMNESYKLSNFLARHPAAEHKAGIAPGGTFVLVYQGAFEPSDFSETELFANPLLNQTNSEKLNSLLPAFSEALFRANDGSVSEIQNMVVGDFSLPYYCCDDCGDMPNAAITLVPLAVPICGVVKEETTTGEDGSQIVGYRPLEIDMVSYVYDQGIYSTEVSSNPQFGKAEIVKVPSKIEPGKETDKLIYTVVPELLRANSSGSFFEVEVLDYQYRDAEGAVVGSSQISIFIPVEGEEEPDIQTAAVRVMVSFTLREARLPVDDAEVRVKGNDDVVFRLVGKGKGVYQADNVPVGRQELVAEHASLTMVRQHIIEVIAPSTNGGEIIMRAPIVVDSTVSFDRNLALLGLERETPEATKVIERFVNNMTEYKEESDKIIERENAGPGSPLTKSRDLIIFFSEEENIADTKLSKDYAEVRNDLLKEIERAGADKKPLYSKALESLTLAYLDRLAVSAPDKFNITTRKTLRETAEIVSGNVDLKSVGSGIEAWTRESEGAVSEKFNVNLGKNFKRRV